MSKELHCLKTWPDHFYALVHGKKTFEVRKADRNFKVDDLLVLQEFDPDTQTFSRAMLTKRITHILTGGQFGIEPGYVVMSLADYTNDACGEA